MNKIRVPTPPTELKDHIVLTTTSVIDRDLGRGFDPEVGTIYYVSLGLAGFVLDRAMSDMVEDETVN